jgi:diaminopimelate decarboxylase
VSNAVFRRENGALFLEQVRLSALLAAGLETPFFVYSAAQLAMDWRAYESAVAGRDAVVGYAIKANSNPALLRRLASFGAGAVVVSDHELRLALQSGFATDRMLLHGNGKRVRDLDPALAAGVLISVDSEFDLEQITARAAALGTTAQLLLRVNPDIDPHVHPYISTGLLDSKFGFAEAAVERLRPRLRHLSSAKVVGLHCHLGSTLKSVQPLRDAARLLAMLVHELRRDGHPIQILDMGGGLGIDYSRGRDQIPSPAELTAAVQPVLDELGLRLFLEPGRSLVARAGALVGRVLGVKDNGRKHFLVTDASMAQLIRPCLYGAFHHIELLEEAEAGPTTAFDVVGPICESGDFLGQGRQLPTPRSGDGVLIYDAGAYGFAMSSRYNLHLGCAEYLIDGDSVQKVRSAENFDDLSRHFTDEPVHVPR